MVKNSIKDLTEGMQRLCAVANRIVASEEGVAAIERDLLLQELRGLYDVALGIECSVGSGQWSVASGQCSEGEVQPDGELLSSTMMATMAAMGVEGGEGKVESVEPEPAAVAEPEPEPMPKMEELENNDNGLLFDEVVIEPEPEPEPVPEPQPEPVIEPEPQPEPKPAPAPDPVAAVGSQASLLDYLKRPTEEQPTVRTLGDTLREQTAAGGQWPVAGGQNKVSDLRTVININDKFSFMSELFHNNMKAYNDFILRLNAIDNRDEALLCVNEVAAQQRWDESSLTVKNFYAVFDKKF